jgi:20S proteasome alpha/beta subunit
MWGCVATGAGNHFIKGIMNKHVYVNILREHLKASAGKLGIGIVP